MNNFQVITINSFAGIKEKFFDTLEDARTAVLTDISNYTCYKTWDELKSADDDVEVSEYLNTVYVRLLDIGFISWVIIKLPKQDTISVDTPAGTLIARVNADCVYPGISVYKDSTSPEAMVSATEYDPNEDMLKIEAYADDIEEPVACIDHKTGRDLL